MSNKSSLLSSLRNLGWPLIIGLGAYTLFYFGVQQELISNEFVLRYFAGHAVCHLVTGMFFVGLAALAMKALEVLSQIMATEQVDLEEPPEGGQPIEDCSRLLDYLQTLSSRVRRSYFGRRLSDAIEFVDRKQSAEGLDDELKYLADLDVARQQESFSLVRILIWATPMMGFLGTVIGITMALEEFGRQDFENDNLSGAMEVLLSGLYVAFDTTALALSLSVVMMFIQFLIDRFETQLLETVDGRIGEHLVGRFEQIGGGADPHLQSIERMSRSVVKSSEELVKRQSEIWKSTISSAHQHWSQLTGATGEQLQGALTNSLDQSLERHGERMQQVETRSAEQFQQRWGQLQAGLAENARAMYEQQQELIKQGEIMKQVVQSTGEVIKLEDVLNENLKALAGSQNFESTVMSLSAAIHLLNARLGQSADSGQRVELKETDPQGRAA